MVWRLVSQAVFLILFVGLLIAGRIQVWVAIFGISVFLSLFLGRFYCGWLCPISTAMNFITKLKKVLGIKSNLIPDSLKRPGFRVGFLISFLAVFVFVIVSGKKLPVLPALLGIGIFVTVFFSENLWHRYLCPYGTILGKIRSKAVYQIKQNLCVSCGFCQKVCPSDAVEVDPQGKYSINHQECLVCGKCAQICPKNAI